MTSRQLDEEEIFHVLYGDHWWDSPLHSRFKNRFPDVEAMLTDMKRKRGRAYPACLLQAVESSFVIGRVCRQIQATARSVPIVTIHDSLLTTPPHVPFVTSVIMHEFKRLGIHAQLKERAL